MINRLSLIAIVSLALAIPALAATPMTTGQLYNSGANPTTATLLPNGSTDILFNVYSFSPAPFTGAAEVVSNPNDDSGWVTSPTAQWIAPVNTSSGIHSTDSPAGSYTYQGSFASDFLVATTVTVTGAFAADNNGQLYINGVLAASTSANGAASLTPINFTFTAAAGLAIIPVQFVVDNVPDNSGSNNPTGLLVTNLAFTTGNAVTPEPATWLLLIGGIGALGFISRRRLASVV